MKKPKTMRERARALAQESVLFGKMRGSQWDGLTELFVAFAENEMKIAASESQGERMSFQGALAPLPDAALLIDPSPEQIAAELEIDARTACEQYRLHDNPAYITSTGERICGVCGEDAWRHRALKAAALLRLPRVPLAAWQPIETAPEATWVLVVVPNYGINIATMTRDPNILCPNGAYWFIRGDNDPCKPTLWHPLPPLAEEGARRPPRLQEEEKDSARLGVCAEVTRPATAFENGDK
jgi:hypothetical protein